MVLSEDLPDPAGLTSLTFAQPTIVYDREGKVELGRFQREQRRVVAFDEVPRLVLDATTTAEDRTFWENGGFDLAAIMAAIAENAQGARERGASTITQQLVRARLLTDEVSGPGSDRYLRKAKELLQSMRLTEAYPGEAGKERVITAYLNEIFYGADAYGIAAAARIYFGLTDLTKLTPAQAALLAALPKSPSSYDPYRYAVKDAEGRLVVPRDAPAVVRRDFILRNLSSSRWTKLSEGALEEALEEPVVLAGVPPLRFRAAHFTWQVRRQLDAIVGDRGPVETGGYQVTTTLDWRGQQIAERWITAAAIVPNLKPTAGDRLLRQLRIPKSDGVWVRALRGKDLHNAALVAIDYRTGDVLAYVGSAGYGRDDLASKEFEPKFDAAGDGARQPGSAFKPIVYASAFENRAITPGSLLLDITTEFDRREDWAPRNADRTDRGPVLARQALQFSLNVPTIRVLQRVGNGAVAETGEALGLRFTGGRKLFLEAGLAGALGTVEVRPIDLTSAYGTIANRGIRVPPRLILEVRGPDGELIYKAPEPKGERALSAATSFLVSDILAGNTDRRQNPIWAEKLELRNGKDGGRRPAAVKTGTAQDARDLATYGFLAPPKDTQAAGLAVGIWMGNSDHSYPRTAKEATSLVAAAPLWRAFVRDYTKGWPVADFVQPKKVVKATIDAWSGGRPGAWTQRTRTEWFLAGTEPGSKRAIDPAGLLYRVACGAWRVDPLKAELGPSAWDRDVADWLARARRGPGVIGRHDSVTAYFYGQSSWGGTLIGPCIRPKPRPTDEPPGGRSPKPPRDRPPKPGDPGPSPTPPAP
ncbi:MAG: transglycosylase domain-containing protein [Chloroflexi bacterium]|nr:transglycosylase domain-containing protein [Chloroflexota bacterium]